MRNRQRRVGRLHSCDDCQIESSKLKHLTSPNLNLPKHSKMSSPQNPSSNNAPDNSDINILLNGISNMIVDYSNNHPSHVNLFDLIEKRKVFSDLYHILIFMCFIDRLGIPIASNSA